MQLTLHLQIATAQPFNIDKKEIQLWVEHALAHAPKLITQGELTLRVIDEAEMIQLNGQFRGQSRPTNVLSFPAEFNTKSMQDYVGDIAICWPVVMREAQQQGKTPTAHFAHLMIHGVLHCLGYDHVEPAAAQHMEALEIEVLKNFNIDNPYEVISHD